VAHLEENVRAASLVLSDAEFAALDRKRPLSYAAAKITSGRKQWETQGSFAGLC
jgi:hypothetical protein